jgi:chromosomal replication initiation ATPase DnaA
MTVASIKQAVAKHYGMSRLVMDNRSQIRRQTAARQVAMMLAWQMTRHSKSRIGDFFDRHPSTVIYAIRTVEQRMSWDLEFRADVEALREALS